MSTLGLLGIALTRELPWTRAEAPGGWFVPSWCSPVTPGLKTWRGLWGGCPFLF